MDNWSGGCQLADGVVSARIGPVIRGVLTKPGYPTRQQNKQAIGTGITQPESALNGGTVPEG